MSKKKSGMQIYTKQDKAILYCGYALLALFLIAIIVPMIYIVIASFMDPVTLQNKGISFDFSKWSLDAYERVISDKQIWVGFKNAVLYSVIFTVISVAVTMLAAYPMSLPDFKGQEIFQHLIRYHDVLQRRSDPYLPAHQQYRSAGFHVGGYPAGCIQRLEYDHCPYLLSGDPA